MVLAGAIVWRKDNTPIKVFERAGKMTNAIWVEINGKRYLFSYNHQTQAVEMKLGGTQGAVVNSFSNSTPAADIKNIFAKL